MTLSSTGGCTGERLNRTLESHPSDRLTRHSREMESIENRVRRSDWFLRRRDLLASGYTDAQIEASLAAHAIFRVRQGWFSVPDAPEAAVRAVRVGGRLTGVAALESYGLRVPRRAVVDVAVPANASRLRRPTDRHAPLEPSDGTRIHWLDTPLTRQSSRWRVSVDDALLMVLRTEERDVAVACASAVMRYLGWGRARLSAVFARAPARVRLLEPLVSDKDDAHGETFVRLWFGDAGVWCESQPRVVNGRRLDFRVGPNTYVEVDGRQHDPDWTGEGESSRPKDVETDIAVAAAGGTVLRFDYRMLYTAWDQCLAAVQRAVADDVELAARRRTSPAVPRRVTTLRTSQTARASRTASASRKRRRSRRSTPRKAIPPPF